MKKASIFSYKDFLGISIPKDMDFINDPHAQGQLGCVISTSNVTITPEAKELIKNKNKRQGGSFAPLMLTKHEGEGLKFGKSSIGVLGFGKVMMEDIEIGRECSLSVLDDCELVTEEPPSDFVEYINSL